MFVVLQPRVPGYPRRRSRGEAFRPGEARPLAAGWPLRAGPQSLLPAGPIHGMQLTGPAFSFSGPRPNHTDSARWPPDVRRRLRAGSSHQSAAIRAARRDDREPQRLRPARVPIIARIPPAVPPASWPPPPATAPPRRGGGLRQRRRPEGGHRQGRLGQRHRPVLSPRPERPGALSSWVSRQLGSTATAGLPIT